MSIFKAYDVRGIYGKDLDEEIAEKIGSAYSTFMNADEVFVGRDVRLSSKSLTSALIDGIIKTGSDVCYIGIIPIGILYFAIMHYNKLAGIEVTASHNPKEFNGFKLCNGDMVLFDKEIQKIREITESGNFKGGKGSLSNKNVVDDYKEYVEKNVSVDKLKVVIDSGNGVCGFLAPEIFREIGCEVIELNSEPDGRFPNRDLDPMKPGAVDKLKETVVREKADFGVAFDGDGDRAGFVDEKGDLIQGDQMLAVFARKILEKKKGKIVFDVKFSQAVIEDIEAHGGEPVMIRTGHPFLREKIMREKALLAGDLAPHTFFNDGRHYGFDDGIYAALRVAELVSGEKLSDLVESLPRYFSTPEIRIYCPEEKKFDIVEKIKGKFSDYKLITVDGIRIQSNMGWALIRASNTEPAVTLRFEGKTKGALEEMKKLVLQELKKEGINV